MKNGKVGSLYRRHAPSVKELNPNTISHFIVYVMLFSWEYYLNYFQSNFVPMDHIGWDSQQQHIIFVGWQ